MDFHHLIQFSIDDVWHSLRLFLPELTLCVTILVVLLARLLRVGRAIGSLVPALAGCVIALLLQAWTVQNVGTEATEIFTGMLVYDKFTVFFRVFLIASAGLFLLLSAVTGVPDRDAAPDIYTLVLGAVLGMCLMASANHLLIVFLGIEIASVPSYALAGMVKGRRRASEAALKFSIYGAGAAGVMLYGISLVAGIVGSVHLPTMASLLAQNLPAMPQGELTVLVLGALMIAVGLAFKLSAVPFHFWTPDVFEGATAEFNGFLSVASKGAALALLVRVAIGFGNPHVEQQVVLAAAEPAGAMAVADPAAGEATGTNAGENGDDGPIAGNQAGGTAGDGTGEAKPAGEVSARAVSDLRDNAELGSPLAPVRTFIGQLVAVLAIITCTLGNLAAYGQTNIKRLLAYSTIAHAGYMMMPVAAALALMNQGEHDLASKAIAALAFYVVVYLFMNMGAFAIVAFLRNHLRSEEISDYAGLVRTSPSIVVCLSLILFSLVGLPPLAGFIGKFLIFWSLTEAQLWTLLVVGGLNTVLSLFYYLRVVKVMTVDPEPESRTPMDMPTTSAQMLYTFVITLPVVALGVLWGGLSELAQDVARDLF